MPKPFRLIKFGGVSCPPCQHMDRTQVLERFADKYPDVQIVKLDVQDADGAAPEGTKFAEYNEISDFYGVSALPELVFEARCENGDIIEIGRVEEAVNFSSLCSKWEKIKRDFGDETPEMSQETAAKQIPWE